MIKNIHIGNYALIDKTNIELEKGFTIITGETGAGKSILLGAIGLTLGQRADVAAIMDKNRKCVVEITYDVVGTIYSNGLLIMTWIMTTRWL
ncbi:MAG: AAA family ATPase [Butyricimonas faecihominis]